MKTNTYSTIIGSGSYIPEHVVKNSDFLDHTFFDPKTNAILDKDNQEIVEKFHEITNISERRWAKGDMKCSDMAALAAKDAFESSGVDPESIDFIIVGHNFADVDPETKRSIMLPTISNKVKNYLGIKNPNCIAHDVMAGCPGWVQSMITANAYIKSGTYTRGLVIGSDVTSTAGDPYDRDCMIFADGAGAVILDATESEVPVGILAQAGRTDSISELEYLSSGPSINKESDQGIHYINMLGSKVYVYALSKVPQLVKDSLDKAGLHIDDISKVLIHQANEKMDEAIFQRLMKLYKRKGSSKEIMPMTIGELGNSSAATVPTMYDLIAKGKLKGHQFNPGENIIFTSVGAGMNINSIVYKIPE